MTQLSDVPSIFVLSRPTDDPATENEVNIHRAGRWTAPKYICSKKDKCRLGETCAHAKPHKAKAACQTAWSQRLGRLADGRQQAFPDFLRVSGMGSSLAENIVRLGERANSLIGVFIELNGIRMDTYIHDVDPTYQGFAYLCSQCVGLPETHRFIPQKRIKLAEERHMVICPASVSSCIGRCSHSEPHLHNRYCKDIIETEGIKLRCRPVSSRRQLLIDGYNLVCHHREP